jgi:O-antigen/teichoic acid export membrane protein
VGLYAAAVALTAPLQLMPRALALVLFATMARLHGAGRASSVRELLDLSTEWLVLALGLLCGLLMVNATAILAALFHRPEYAQATTATQLVVCGAYLLMISSPAISALSSTTYVWIPTIASILGLGTSLALWLLLIPPLGITGAGLGFAAGSVITGSIPAFFASRLIGTRRVRFLRLGAILAALVAVLLGLERVPLVASAVFVVVLALLYVRPARSLLRVAVHAYRARDLRRGSELT